MLQYLVDNDKRTIVFLSVSAAALVMSFFQLGNLPIDPAWVAIVLCGFPIIKGAVEGLITEFDVKADVLVSIALIASVIISEIFAAGEVAFIMAIGAYLEERTVKKARAGIERLVHLTPTTARIIQDGVERIVPAEQVRENDVLRVLPGETVAVDGVISKGQTSIDQSVMTGEPLPVDKQAGDDVFSGTVNQFGAFEMVATKVGENSSLQRMIRLVESADAGKAKIVGIADRWATWIVVIALLSAIATWAVTGEAVRAVTILVVFCPCALVLATPTAIMAGIGNATSYGILVREGDALERLAAVSRIAFDKTGTLTLGQPAVVGVESVNPAISAEQLLQHAAMAELHSEHPLGKAVVAYCTQRKEGRPAEPDAFAMLAGRGVIAEKDGKKILAGNETLLRENNIELTDAVLAAAETAKKSGGTVIFVAIDNQPAGIVTLSDTIRPDAAQTVKAIHDTGIQTILLTGDGPLAASHMSSLAGISDCRSSCLPEDKMSVIKNYQDKGVAVCMVGDGINDAPALKTASVGIAMGAVGSDISIEAADIALVGDNIRDIPHLLRLAKRTMRTINVNLTASMALNFVAIGLAVAGLLNPVLGALVHNAGSVAVIINSSLLLKWKGQ